MNKHGATKMRKEELKPCPFCGLIRNIRIVTSHNDYTGALTPWRAGVLCAHCGNAEVTLGGETKEDAIASTALIWNIRPIEDELRAALDAAEAENARLRERLEAALDKIAEIQDEWESEGVCHACGICAGIPYEWQRPDGFCCRVALGLWIEGKPLPWKDAARQAVTAVEGEENE